MYIIICQQKFITVRENKLEMSLGNALLVTIGLIVIFFCHTTSSECTVPNVCSCILPEKETKRLINFTHEGLNGINELSMLYVDPCNITTTESNENSVKCKGAKKISLCAHTESINNTVQIGIVTEKKVELGYNNVIVRIPNLNVTMDISCCTKCTTQIVTDSNPNLQYNFLLKSPDICKEQVNNKRLSTGSVLVILLIVFSGLYFIGGAIILKLLRGATGVEMLPNHEFWCELPSLIRDGIAFTFSCCRVDSYERI